jgi:hypothetical protein
MNAFKEETPDNRANREVVGTVEPSSEDLRTATEVPDKFEINTANEQEIRAEMLREVARVELLRSVYVVHRRYCDRLLEQFASVSEPGRRKGRHLEANIARSGARIITTQKREGKTRESALSEAIYGATKCANKYGLFVIPGRSMRLIETALERHYPTKQRPGSGSCPGTAARIR